MKKKVAVLYGGRGCEHDISVSSAENLFRVIDRERYLPIPIYIDKGGIWHTCDGEVTLSSSAGLLLGGKPLGCEVVFPILHGDYGEDGSIAGALEAVGIDYVGPRATTGAILIDKAYTKMLAENIGIPTVPYVTVDRRTRMDEAIERIEKRLGYPVFVKPATLGSSIGAARADTRSDLTLAIADALSLGDKALVERYVDGRREIEVAYLGYQDGEIITPGGEIITDGWYDYNEKYSDKSGARVIARADIDDDVSGRLTDYTRRLVRLFGIRQISRLDYFVLGEEIYLNEINAMPGFTEASLYPRLIAECGISPTELVTLLIEGASVI